MEKLMLKLTVIFGIAILRRKKKTLDVPMTYRQKVGML